MNSFAESNIAAAIQDLKRARAALEKARAPARAAPGGLTSRELYTHAESMVDVSVCLAMAEKALENALTLEAMTTKDEEEKKR